MHKEAVSISKFNQVCLQYQVFLTNEELRKLAQLSTMDDID